MLSSGLWKVVSPPPFAHQVAFSTPTHTPGLGPSLILKGELREPPPFFFFWLSVILSPPFHLHPKTKPEQEISRPF